MTPKTARKFAYSDPLKTQLDRAKSTRADLEAEKAATQLKLAELSRQILRTNGYIKSIKVLIEGTGALKPPETSLADFCRRGLNHFGDWVTAIEVRDYLVDLGVHLRYKNNMSVIHMTLSRVGECKRSGSGPVYRSRPAKLLEGTT